MFGVFVEKIYQGRTGLPDEKNVNSSRADA